VADGITRLQEQSRLRSSVVPDINMVFQCIAERTHQDNGLVRKLVEIIDRDKRILAVGYQIPPL
jgi:DNA-directed RNA polymerase subunit L